MILSETVLECTHCDPCVKLAELNKPWGHTGVTAEFYKGFVGVQVYSNAPEDYDDKIQQLICPFCNNKLVDTKFRLDDLHLLGRMSECNRQVLDAMMKLCKDDPIEYQLKINQFKLQKEEKKQQFEDSLPHCPHCKSTNIKSISGVNRGMSIAMLGILSNKINKSFECKNCGYTW